jgi:hypothetical protein
MSVCATRTARLICPWTELQCAVRWRLDMGPKAEVPLVLGSMRRVVPRAMLDLECLDDEFQQQAGEPAITLQIPVIG